MPEITIPFDLKRTPRELVTAALEQLASVHCPHHPHERLNIDRETTLTNLVQTHSFHLSVTHEHCKACPFVTRDRSAFDKWHHNQIASEIAQNGFVFGIESCAALPYTARKRPNFAISLNEAPRPVTSVQETIAPDLPPEQQLARWIAVKGRASCAFGRTAAIPCGDLLPVIESSVTLRKAQQEWDEKVDSRRLAAYTVCPAVAPCPGCRVARCGVSPVLQHASFDNFIIEPPAIAAHLTRCRDYAANPIGFLLMLGSVGNGKSHLAVAIARAQSEWGTLFLSHNDFLLRQRARYGAIRSSARRREEEEDSPDVLTSTRGARLLIFDDLGRRHEGRDEEALLFSLFNHRYEHRLPTIITSNLSRTDFERFLGAALFDRLREACFASLEFNFPSKRRGLNDTYLKSCIPVTLS